MSTTIVLNNQPIDEHTFVPNTYYPRLQANKQGEIVLALYKHGSLTTGILVGRIPGSAADQLCYFAEPYRIGEKFDDWEVGGELTDYDGEVELTIKNKERSS